jgi:ATP-binding cassette subfamily C protein
VVLVDGREAEMGTFDELMERDGVFASLVKRQMA